MDSQKRLLVALGLSFVLTMVYTTFFAPKPPPAPAVPTAQVASPPPAAAPSPELAAARAAAPSPSNPGVESSAPRVTVPRNFGLIHYLFDSEGGSLVRAELQGRKTREQGQVSWIEGYQRMLGKQIPEPPPMDMATPPVGVIPSLGFALEGAQPISALLRYRPVEDPQHPERLVFEAETAGWKVVRSYEWTGAESGFVATVALTNTGAVVASGDLAVHYARAVDPAKEEPPNFFGGVGNQSRSSCAVGEKVERLLPKDDPNPEFHGPIHFFGVDQQYFLGALYPLDGAREGRCTLSATPTARSVVARFPVMVAPGATMTQRFGVYIGPKDVELLEMAPSSLAPRGQALAFQPHLERTVDFGIWAFICNLLLLVMKAVHKLIPNWGVAIILLTVGVKLVLLPLTHKQMVSAEAMKKLQPKMEELKKKFGEDRERLSLETMKLYQEAKVNPLGGCLPLLVQMPIWFALFTTLRNSYEIYREPFISPIWMDLTYKDPTYLLPLGLGVTMILTQRLQPQMMDAAQARIFTYVMPVFFTAIMLNYPSGLSLYIFTNNLLSIIQQYGLRRYLDRPGAAAGRGSAKEDRSRLERQLTSARASEKAE